MNDLVTIDLSKKIPDLSKLEAATIDVVANYWSPTQRGEQKRVIFNEIKQMKAKDFQDENNLIDLECADFVEQIDGVLSSVSNASARLVSALINANIAHGTPLLITYLGKEKNKNNAFESDVWSIKPLIVK